MLNNPPKPIHTPIFHDIFGKDPPMCVNFRFKTHWPTFSKFTTFTNFHGEPPAERAKIKVTPASATEGQKIFHEKVIELQTKKWVEMNPLRRHLRVT